MFRIELGILIIIFYQISFSHCVRNGERPLRTDFLAQVAIRVTAQKEHLCGGTIIDAKHVLTSASCVVINNYLMQPSNVSVQADDKIIDNSVPERLTVSTIYIHENYNPKTFENDICVVRMETDFKSTDAGPHYKATLQSQSVADKIECRISGWYPHKEENDDDDDAVGISLTFLKTTIQNREKVCNKQPNHNGKVKEKMFCAKMFKTSENPDKVGVCSTTRGGGLYCTNNDVVTGVLSFGFSCGNSDIPSVYTQVHMYREWIQNQYKRTDVPRYGDLSSSATTMGFTMMTLIGSLLITRFF